MESLVNYQSGEESDIDDDGAQNEDSTNGGEKDLASEWERFASCIETDESTPVGVQPPELATKSTGSEDNGQSTDDEDKGSGTGASEHDSSDESGSSEAEQEEEDEEENGSGSSGQSSEESEEGVGEEEDEDVPNDEGSPYNKEDDVVKNRFRSRSPVDRKSTASDEARVDRSSADRHSSVGKSSNKSHRSSHDEGRRRSSEHGERRKHRSRSGDRKRRGHGSRGSRDRDRKRRSRSKDRHRSGHDKHRGESRRSGSRRHGRKRRDSDRRRHKDRRRSRSRDRHGKDHKRRRSRERQQRGKRSRSKSPLSGPKKARSAREKMKEQLLQAQAQAGGGLEALKKHLAAGGQISDPRVLLMGTSLNTTGEKVTPQEAIRQQMEAMQQKAQELTGVAIPKYYNPAAVNPLKYAEQVQKRKLLWSKAKEKTEDPVHTQQTALWQATSFGQEKTDEKFRKLMGVKGGGGGAGGEGAGAMDAATAQLHSEQVRKQQELFTQLDKEYMMARMTTHTHRGMGLGILSFNTAVTTSTTQSQPSNSQS